MRIGTFALLFFFFATLATAGSALHVVLSFEPNQQVLGCSVIPIVTLENAGGRTLQVPDEHTIVAVLHFTVPEGGRISFYWGSSFDGMIRWEDLAPGAKKVYRLKFEPRVCEAGTYPIIASYDDRHYSPPSREPLHATSEPVQLVYTEPSGSDAEAFRSVIADIQAGAKAPIPCAAPSVVGWFLRQPQFLGRFPTSIYAAYVIYERMAGFAKQDPAVVLGVVHDENSYNSNSYPDDTGKSKDGWRWLKGKEAVDWWARWYDIILKSHPDIWFADELRLKRAVDQLALKNYQAAQAELEAISKDEKAPMAHKAKEYLGLMKQKGWVKS